MMRNLYTLLPNDMLWFGDPRIGIPASEIPEGSIGYEIAELSCADNLLRFYINYCSDASLTFDEYGVPSEVPIVPVIVNFDLYKNGEFFATYTFTFGPSATGIARTRKTYMSAGI